MQTKLLAALLFATACVAPADDPMTQGGGSGSAHSWIAMPLLDDHATPDRIIYHQGNDRVTGIYFDSADHGVIVSQGADETASRGGAVFLARGGAVSSIAFSGDDTGLGLAGSIDFTGIARTPDGYIAMAYANDVIVSRDNGATFGIERNGAMAGIEPVLGYRVTSSGTTFVRETGVVDIAASAPGASASYTDVWAPNASPSIPTSVPAEQCQDGPLGTGAPVLTSSVYIAPDRQLVAYSANSHYDPEVCISTDGGRSFYPHSLGMPSTVDNQIPTGVLFTTATTGIAWFASPIAGSFLRRTTDGGTTWSEVALPYAAHELELPAAFFAPDGVHGWLVGFDHTTDGAVAISTSDGGTTWSPVAGIADAVAAAGGDKLYSGFALDADHVWIGGAHGVLLRK